MGTPRSTGGWQAAGQQQSWDLNSQLRGRAGGQGGRRFPRVRVVSSPPGLLRRLSLEALVVDEDPECWSRDRLGGERCSWSRGTRWPSHLQLCAWRRGSQAPRAPLRAALAPVRWRGWVPRATPGDSFSPAPRESVPAIPSSHSVFAKTETMSPSS